ncbi:hypothetical protein D3C73_1491980 [compost metagenome]
MKGRRKVFGCKWALKSQLVVEANRALAKKSKKAANRFLDATLVFGSDFEPAGRLAGDSPSPSERDNRNTPLNPDVIGRAVRNPDLAVLLSRTIEVVVPAPLLKEARHAR